MDSINNTPSIPPLNIPQNGNKSNSPLPSFRGKIKGFFTSRTRSLKATPLPAKRTSFSPRKPILNNKTTILQEEQNQITEAFNTLFQKISSIQEVNQNHLSPQSMKKRHRLSRRLRSSTSLKRVSSGLINNTIDPISTAFHEFQNSLQKISTSIKDFQLLKSIFSENLCLLNDKEFKVFCDHFENIKTSHLTPLEKGSNQAVLTSLQEAIKRQKIIRKWVDLSVQRNKINNKISNTDLTIIQLEEVRKLIKPSTNISYDEIDRRIFNIIKFLENEKHSPIINHKHAKRHSLLESALNDRILLRKHFEEHFEEHFKEHFEDIRKAGDSLQILNTEKSYFSYFKQYLQSVNEFEYALFLEDINEYKSLFKQIEQLDEYKQIKSFLELLKHSKKKARFGTHKLTSKFGTRKHLALESNIERLDLMMSELLKKAMFDPKIHLGNKLTTDNASIHEYIKTLGDKEYQNFLDKIKYTLLFRRAKHIYERYLKRSTSVFGTANRYELNIYPSKEINDFFNPEKYEELDPNKKTISYLKETLFKKPIDDVTTSITQNHLGSLNGTRDFKTSAYFQKMLEDLGLWPGALKKKTSLQKNKTPLKSSTSSIFLGKPPLPPRTSLNLPRATPSYLASSSTQMTSSSKQSNREKTEVSDLEDLLSSLK